MKMLLIAIAALAQSGTPQTSQESKAEPAAPPQAMGMAGMTSDEMRGRCAMMAKHARARQSATKPMTDADRKAMRERCAAMMNKTPPSAPAKP